jgi:chitodextrinase
MMNAAGFDSDAVCIGEMFKSPNEFINSGDGNLGYDWRVYMEAWANDANCSVFDFATKERMQNGDVNSWRWGMNGDSGNINRRARAITFVDNHDTSYAPAISGNNGQALWPFKGDRNQGYTYILTSPGTPSIYWPDVFDGWTSSGHIAWLMDMRKKAQIYADSGITWHSDSNYTTYGADGNLNVDLWSGNVTCSGNCNYGIPVNTPPQAIASVDNDTISEGGSVSVDGSASTDADAGDGIASHAWSVSDGQSASGAIASFTFANSGTYTVTLTVTDNNGASSSDSFNVTVQDPSGNIAGLNTKKKTVVFIYGQTETGQDMFVRGGIGHEIGSYSSCNSNTQCGTSGDRSQCECAIDIQYNNDKKQFASDPKINTIEMGWQQNDTHLDWYGMQPGQGNGAEGTAFTWTVDEGTGAGWGMTDTVDTTGFGIDSLNTSLNLGPHYWKLDVMMDCSKAVEGKFFEVKSYITNGPGWESNVDNSGHAYLQGSAMAASQNHVGECGKINIFQRNSSSANIQDF